MKRLGSNRGLTLVELLVAAGIASIVIFAVTSTVVYLFEFQKKIEKQTNSASESIEMSRIINRGLKNLSLSRFQFATTFVRTDSGAISSMGVNPNTVVPAYTVDANALKAGGTGPLLAAVNAELAGPTYNVFLDSFLTEEYIFESAAGSLIKKTKRLTYSRCDILDNSFDFVSEMSRPGTLALYTLVAMKRRPFIKLSGSGSSTITCCPVSNPNCTDGDVNSSFFRVYSMVFDKNNRLLTVEEFPKSVSGSTAIGAGFWLNLRTPTSSSFVMESFLIESRCASLTVKNNPHCKSNRTSIETIKDLVGAPDLLRILPQTLNVPLSSDIVNTGVISL